MVGIQEKEKEKKKKKTHTPKFTGIHFSQKRS
jgi:hypothetical protein